MSLPVDFKGFERELWNARAALRRHDKIYVFRMGSGFAFRGHISERLEDMIDQGEAELIGVYQKPLSSPDLIEDLIFAKGNEDANKRIHRGLSRGRA